jgi:nucleoside-diphosphate-sugar epimerase
VPRDENELIVPARDGALRVLRAARDAGVKRVVLTSSFAAIGYGHAPCATPFDESTWTNLAGPGVSAYARSKTIAERAAWDFLAREGGALELAVVNPVGVFGPVWGRDFSTSIVLVQRLLNGSVPGCPRLSFGVVDVRDVVDLHLRAMTQAGARGERFLAVAGPSLSILDMALVLKRGLGAAAKKVPTWQLPDWLVRLAALRDRSLRQIIPELGKVKQASHAKATRVLGWAPRSAQTALLATGESLVRLGAAGKDF